MTLGPKRATPAALACCVLALLACASPARAGWAAAPVPVRATSSLCPLVAAAGDGHGGAIVAWQEGSAASGVLRAQHVTASGDADASWNGPVTLCLVNVQRQSLGAVSDGVGGAFVWWTEGTALYVTRVSPQGAVAGGWSARGTLAGTLPTADHRPLAKADGQGGLYLGWLDSFGFTLRVARLAPGGGPAAGWPAAGRTLSLGPGPDWIVRSFGFDPTADGGLWVGVQTFALCCDPGALMVQRFDPAGLPASGALGLAPLAWTEVDLTGSRTGTLALAGDGQGGLYLASVDAATATGGTLLQPRLRRIGPGGLPPAGWSYDGVQFTPQLQPTGTSAYADASVLALAGTHGEVYVGLPAYPAGDDPQLSFARLSSTGAMLPGALLADQMHIDTAPRDDGGLFVAACKPAGPSPGLPSPAFVGAWQLPSGAGYHEDQGGSTASYYDDVALAPTGDGGAIVAWGQHLGRQGVFAVRLNPAGPVTGVSPPANPTAARVWFARGAGVRVSGGAGRVTLALRDLSGREVARGESADAGEWTVPGTAGLPSGMYFAELVAGGRELRAKVVVVR